MTERELREEIRERKREARDMRRTLAAWVCEGVPQRQMRREWARLHSFEAATKRLERLLTPDDRPSGMLQIGFVREGESS